MRIMQKTSSKVYFRKFWSFGIFHNSLPNLYQIVKKNNLEATTEEIFISFLSFVRCSQASIGAESQGTRHTLCWRRLRSSGDLYCCWFHSNTMHLVERKNKRFIILQLFTCFMHIFRTFRIENWVLFWRGGSILAQVFTWTFNTLVIP